MNEKLPSREQAISLLIENGCSQSVVRHCIAVADLAIEIAAKLQLRKSKLDIKLVEVGALLHDIGRSKTHTVNHLIAGVEIACSKGLPESIVSIIKRHVGGGITPEEAKKLGWPNDNYVPTSLEEKIVCYADKLIEGSKRVPIEITLDQLATLNNGAAERVRKLRREITALVGAP